MSGSEYSVESPMQRGTPDATGASAARRANS